MQMYMAGAVSIPALRLLGELDHECFLIYPDEIRSEGQSLVAL